MSFFSVRATRTSGPAYPEGNTPFTRRIRVWIVVLSAILVVLGGFGAHLYARYLNRSPGKVRLYDFTIAPGMSARQVGEHLERNEAIRSGSFFALAARVMDFDTRIHAGTHWINGSESTVAILRQLLSGGLRIARVTVPEGLTIREVAALMADSLSLSADTLDSLARSPELVAAYAFPSSPSLEGFLFPDTYYFDAGAGPRTVIKTMAGRFHELFTDGMKARAESLRMSPLDVLTLASIIEKEAMVHREQAVISQVFHKRLRLGYRLGADPTVKYALDREPRRLSLRDIEVDSPYNTYKYLGLPPGPICNPGNEAIRAALWPAQTDYLYFVANWDGTHTFTKTFRDHNIAKTESDRRYRKWRADQRMRAGR